MAMTMKLDPNMAITALLAVLLLSAAACSDRNAQARLTMTAADSLMTADPQAALDTLTTIDSTDAAGLPRADRALYTLLRTEAEYKCYMPSPETPPYPRPLTTTGAKGRRTGWPVL